MTPTQLLARDYKSETDFGSLQGCYYNHLEELGFNLADLERTEAPGIELRIYGHRDYDQRRYWTLAAVYFNGVSVMIVQNAGREGDDHYERFILSPDAYFQMLAVIAALPRRCVWDRGLAQAELVTLDEELEGLDEFYGDRLDGCAVGQQEGLQ